MSETPRDEPIMFLITEAELRNNNEMALFQLIAKRLREAQDAIATRDLHETMARDGIAKRDAEKPQ